ncbi:hypothetical protein cyc_01005 [Cyclospora cayetanensis]|uniref:Uncharacterized protein n=1 Tax=Cyclospora cayetanensis TaxID=88456 RepID=A0A1D3CWF9_9EIME|nr:hypothetical protein cyc_01005 [Cyclospora cayetanensis]
MVPSTQGPPHGGLPQEGPFVASASSHELPLPLPVLGGRLLKRERRYSEAGEGLKEEGPPDDRGALRDQETPSGALNGPPAADCGGSGVALCNLAEALLVGLSSPKTGTVEASEDIQKNEQPSITPELEIICPPSRTGSQEGPPLSFVVPVSEGPHEPWPPAVLSMPPAEVRAWRGDLLPKSDEETMNLTAPGLAQALCRLVLGDGDTFAENLQQQQQPVVSAGGGASRSAALSTATGSLSGRQNSFLSVTSTTASGAAGTSRGPSADPWSSDLGEACQEAPPFFPQVHQSAFTYRPLQEQQQPRSPGDTGAAALYRRGMGMFNVPLQQQGYHQATYTEGLKKPSIAENSKGEGSQRQHPIATAATTDIHSLLCGHLHAQQPRRHQGASRHPPPPQPGPSWSSRGPRGPPRNRSINNQQPLQSSFSQAADALSCSYPAAGSAVGGIGVGGSQGETSAAGTVLSQAYGCSGPSLPAAVNAGGSPQVSSGDHSKEDPCPEAAYRRR